MQGKACTTRHAGRAAVSCSRHATQPRVRNQTTHLALQPPHKHGYSTHCHTLQSTHWCRFAIMLLVLTAHTLKCGRTFVCLAMQLTRAQASSATRHLHTRLRVRGETAAAAQGDRRRVSHSMSLEEGASDASRQAHARLHGRCKEGAVATQGNRVDATRHKCC